jgi:hypothetical protein
MKANYKIALTLFMFFLLFALALFWMGGISFNKRDETNLMCVAIVFGLIIGSVVMAATFPKK